MRGVSHFRHDRSILLAFARGCSTVTLRASVEGALRSRNDSPVDGWERRIGPFGSFDDLRIQGRAHPGFEMFFSRHIGMKRLAQFCGRLGIAMDAGVDVRRSLAREAQSGSSYHRSQVERISQAVNRGDSIPEAVQATGDYFPEFFREMVELGDRTGRLDRVLKRLAEHYEHLVTLRRIFLLGIAWPVIELVIAIGVIGVLILVLGWVARRTGENADLLGFGLVGFPGLVRYVFLLSLLALCGYGLFLLFTRGPLANRLAQGLMFLPGIGTSLRTMAMARMAWTLGLAFDSGADALQSVRLALKSTVNPYYTQHLATLQRSIRSGQVLHDAMRETGAFPEDFLDAVQVGEESGKLSESLLKLAEQYQDRARTAATGLTVAASIAVWLFVAMILILMIFRLFGAYMGILRDVGGF